MFRKIIEGRITVKENEKVCCLSSRLNSGIGVFFVSLCFRIFTPSVLPILKRNLSKQKREEKCEKASVKMLQNWQNYSNKSSVTNIVKFLGLLFIRNLPVVSCLFLTRSGWIVFLWSVVTWIISFHPDAPVKSLILWRQTERNIVISLQMNLRKIIAVDLEWKHKSEVDLSLYVEWTFICPIGYSFCTFCCL